MRNGMPASAKRYDANLKEYCPSYGFQEIGSIIGHLGWEEAFMG